MRKLSKNNKKVENSVEAYGCFCHCTCRCACSTAAATTSTGNRGFNTTGVNTMNRAR